MKPFSETRLTTKNNVSNIKWAFFGFLTALLLVLILMSVFYVKPRARAYVNAIKIAHSHPEVIESLQIKVATISGSFVATVQN